MDSLSTHAITVVTLTRQRPTLLRRAINSVRLQSFAGRVDHLIVIDDCKETFEHLRAIESTSSRRLIPKFVQRDHGEIPEVAPKLDVVYPRIARLLNTGVQAAQSRWIAFLDDDNEYEVNHLSTLVDCALRYDCAAVHSHRKVFHADGSPYLEKQFPWARDPGKAAQIYELLCSRGVWVRGSNVLKDRAGPGGLAPFQNSTLLAPWSPVFMVDTSVWLLERSLLLKYPIPETFTELDLRNNMAPDDLLLEVLIQNDIRIVSTGLPTLRYYLGGISNPARSDGSERPDG